MGEDVQNEELLNLMRTRPGWSLEELADHASMVPTELEKRLRGLLKEESVHRSPKGRWRAIGAVKTTNTSTYGEWGRRTRILIYSPEILAACPEFTRNTFLHFVEDEDHHFRLRDYVDGKRIEVKEVAGIVLSRELATEYPRYELEFDDEEEHTPLTDNEFWEKRIAAYNASHSAMLEKSVHIVEGEST